MDPIRVAIIGLSANAVTSWASRAYLPYLLSPAGKAHFEIVALCNSSVASAKRAIAAFALAPQTRAYGTPAELADDPDMRLVINCTRVDLHFETSLPSIRAGKDVFVEWPLADNVARAAELASAARDAGVKTVVGLQGWFIPTTLKLKEIIASGRIGKVTSSELRGGGWTSDRASVSSQTKYFIEKRVGGNLVTIGFGHIFDWVQHTLGDVKNIKSHLQLQRPSIKVYDSQTGVFIENAQSDVPDLIYVMGTLSGTKHIAQDATLHLRFRRAQVFEGEPALVWSILGEKGEIRLTALANTMLQISSLADVTIHVEDHDTGTVEPVTFAWGPYPELSFIARSYGPLYEAYASGAEGEYADFEHGLKRHKQLENVWSGYDAVPQQACIRIGE